MRFFKKKRETVQSSEYDVYKEEIEEIFSDFLKLHENNINDIKEKYSKLLETDFFLDIKRKYGEIDGQLTKLMKGEGCKDKVSDAKSLLAEYESFVKEKFENIPFELEMAERNIKVLDDILNKHCLFFAVIPRNNENTKLLYFSYELRRIKDTGCLVFLTLENGLTVKKWFSANQYIFRPMTRDEFEDEFLINHLSDCSFKNEIELIEYDHFLRQMFLKQEQ